MNARAGASGAGVVFLGSLAVGQVTERVSVATGGAQANSDSISVVNSVSADGRFVVFYSWATNLFAGDGNLTYDAFVRDRQSGTTEIVSASTGGAQGDAECRLPAISADGRFVTFSSFASNLVAGDTNGFEDIFVRDILAGTTERVSIANDGSQANWENWFSTISADGRYVAFGSIATNLVAGDLNGVSDVFVRDRQAGGTELVTVSSAGVQSDSYSAYPSITPDGRYIVFHSGATNLVPWDTNALTDVFVRDRLSGTTERISVSTTGAQGNSDSGWPAISADGRFVAFASSASNLVAGDTGGYWDVFVRDRQLATTERVSVSTSGVQGDGHSNWADWASVSADGRYVAFKSDASNLVAGDTNGNVDIFVRDRLAGTTERVSLATGSVQADSHSYNPSISADGRFVVFRSGATNLVPGDTNGAVDIFVRNRNVSGFTSHCEPGVAGVLPCPCSNPASGSDRGCDNSSGTGGAALSAAGAASISQDRLVFTTSGEKPAAASIVMQATQQYPGGLVFGQGVRCALGGHRRLYLKQAVSGSITAPDFGAGDPSVSARSAALGDVIAAGQIRWYYVYYRDPVVLGGCNPGSTFNVTQTGRVVWSF